MQKKDHLPEDEHDEYSECSDDYDDEDNEEQLTVHEVKPLIQGNILGLVCSFHNGKDGNVYSLCQFLHDGESIGIAMRMTGKTVTPMIFINPETTTVNSSLSFGKSKIKEGNISMN